jgi:hypothetical protein
MPISRSFLGVAFLAASILTTSTPANSLLAASNAKVSKTNHLDHLHKAALELKHAHSATGKNGGKAAQHVATAIGHIEAAIQHHKTLLNQNRSGVSGAIATAAHHKHHSHLQEALHAAKAAEKQIASGNASRAAADISKAHHHVELAMHSHNALIGK